MTTVLRESFATIRSGFVSSSQPVIVLGTTTDVDKLPTGVIGLFKEELSIEAPGEPERLAILQSLTKSEHLAPDVALRSLAVQTAALVANDLVDLVRRAKAAAAERVLSLLSNTILATSTTDSSSTRPPLPTLNDLVNSGISFTSDDFSKALEAARSSYSESIGAPKIPNVTWDDVGGLANVKSDILDTIQLPLEKPELFADGLKKRSGESLTFHSIAFSS
jgi:peroxin-6